MNSYPLHNNIISRHQHGFLNCKSTSTQLLDCKLDWNIALNIHISLDIIYLHYAKAFDYVVHSKLLTKHACYGINHMVIVWIKCFLSNRSQFVKVGHCSSSPCDVLSGVPQGSVLGHVLFVLFVNDICNIVPSGVNLKLFADDVKLYSVINSTVTPNSLQACLSAIHDWSEHWQLKLSPAKCTCCTFHPTV